MKKHVEAPVAKPSSLRWLLYLLPPLCLLAAIVMIAPASRNDSEPVAEAAPSAPPEGMVWIPGGPFWMGTTNDGPHFADAAPVHRVSITGFWMDATEVTNAQYAEFVKATGYQTVAERKPTMASIKRGLPADAELPAPEMLVPGALVFIAPKMAVDWSDVRNWWSWVPGACWQHPEGPGSTTAGREQHPVVHIAWDDAVAYAEWAGKRLPTEAEWELAARGGLDRKPFVWGDVSAAELDKFPCNIWQGEFPHRNTTLDGHVRTAPVASFAANSFGLFDMAGNVWEWCADWYRPDYYQKSPKVNPRGPDSSFDPAEANTTVPKRVQRGGSFLCSDGFCSRYRPAGRGKGDIDTGLSHVGFRCVKDR